MVHETEQQQLEVEQELLGNHRGYPFIPFKSVFPSLKLFHKFAYAVLY